MPHPLRSRRTHPKGRRRTPRLRPQGRRQQRHHPAHCAADRPVLPATRQPNDDGGPAMTERREPVEVTITATPLGSGKNKTLSGTPDTIYLTATRGATPSPWMPLPLRACLTWEPGLPVAVTLSASGLDAVLVGRVGTAAVELLREGRLVREADTTLAAPVTDPTRQVELLRAAL